MKAFKLLSGLFFALSLTLNAQDTTIVQTLEFNDITKRRGWYIFPPDTGSYRQVLMYYTLKCDPQTTQDGYDCGEWDYTTLTNAYTYQGVGTPYYSINGTSYDTIYYTAVPSYNYYQSYQYFPNYLTTVSETDYNIGSGLTNLNESIDGNYQSHRSQYIVLQSELTSAGISTGDIHKLKLDFNLIGGDLNNLTIRLKNSTLNELTPGSYESTGLQTVYQLNTNSLSIGTNTFNFLNAFNWDGTSNIVVDISYENQVNGSAYELVGDATGFNSGVYLDAENRALAFSQPDYVEVPATAFTAIDSFITVEFWSYGDPNIMPSNSYAFEGRDAGGNRVINSHLPWSNSRVYWDAGNSGGGAYDRIDLAANFSDFAGQWNHWAFVKDVSLGQMQIYLNGQLFHSGTGLTRTMAGITNFRIAAPANSPGRYDGSIDEFRVWDAALSQTEIQNYLYKSVDPTHPNYSNLLLEYGFNELTGQTVLDASSNSFNGTMMGLPTRVNYSGYEHNFNMTQSTNRPNLTFVQGIYTTTMDSVLVLDSVEVDQISITEQTTSIDINQTGILYTNVDTIIAYPGDFWTYTYDPNGIPIDSNYVPAAHSLITTLKPITHQIQNYVTPYGIGLDLGPNGFRWVYDVTDYIPLLRDTLEISAGNQQELIDLKFLFIEGTPPRDIIDFETIWTGNYSHANIANNVSLPAVDVDLDPTATNFSLKTRATGHWFGGFENCAEFCPKLHNIKIDGTKEFEWMVWKECANNPVVDQGGTWVYDRAGWCPGTFANTYDYNITPFVTPGSSASIDYGMQTTAGGMEGNYWVSLQMVSYGDINFVNDAEIIDIIAPNSWEYHNRLNPMCSQPIIKIRNSGSDTLKSLDIKYRVAGGQDVNFHWTGELAFMEEDTVELHPIGDWFWFSGNGSKVFEVECENPNGITDENPDNNLYKSEYEAPVVLPSHFYFWIQTNNAASENAYYLMDWQGDTIFSRDNWTNATTYRDTFLLADGCYTMKLIDRDHDGLSFFANSDGNGQFRWKGVGAGTIYTLENNFGDELIMHFTVGGTLSDQMIDGAAFANVYPNPSNTGWFKVDTEGFYGELRLEVINAQGKLVNQLTELDVNGSKQIELNLSSLSKGIYFLKMNDGNVSATKRLVIN